MPSGRSPSFRSRPIGSVIAGIWALFMARQVMPLRFEWRCCIGGGAFPGFILCIFYIHLILAQAMSCVLRLHKTTDGKSAGEVVRIFHFHIPAEVVAAYFYVPPSPEPEVPPARASTPLTSLLSRASQLEPETVTVPPATPELSCHNPRDIAETVNRLAKPTRSRPVGTSTTMTSICVCD